MEFEGKLVGGMRIDIDTGNTEFTIQSMRNIGQEWDKLRKHEKLSVVIKPYRAKRSLDANAYYWKKLTELADCLRVSKSCLHNRMLRRYGQPEIIDGKMVYLVLPDSDSGAQTADEAETYHIRPTSQIKTGTDGKPYRTYLMLRGSRTYDTREMSILIDGLVSECQECGIETLTPDEIKRMMETYEVHWRKHHGEDKP